LVTPTIRGSFATVVPTEVVIVDARGDVPEAVLLPEEAASLGAVVEKRRREFTVGRHCARRALARLGIGPAPILPGKSRAPVWPPDIVGSITHCAGYCAAAVARGSQFLTIGIDAEVHRSLPAGVFERVSLPQERSHLSALDPHDVCWDCVLFSAKESVYKAWFPITNGWLGFEDVAVTVAPDTRTFEATLLVPAPLVDGRPIVTFAGRFEVDRDHVITAVVVPKTT
jgi:4'-phosphopantetheinyl transferase EntD